jgi:hypothetical protein
MGATARKERRTYSLDPELVRYVESVRKKFGTASASSALEEIIRADKHRDERRRQEDKISRYYGSLNDAEVEQESQWGAFSESQFPMDK